MISERLDVRLDTEHRRRLDAIAAEQGVSVSEAVRNMIDRAYEQSRQAERLRVVQEMARLEVDDVPEPAELNRILDDTHAIPDLY